jgi:hypothetical protein|nr:MAG TPA: chromosome segregation protein [Caudoviricetes sp.]
MALLSTYQKFKEKNAQGVQSEPQKQETQKESSGSGLMSTYQQFMSKKQGGTQAVSPAQDYNQRVWDVLQRVDSANASRNGGWSADVTGGNGLEINALLREYDAYEGDKSGMTDYRNMLLGYNKQMQELNGYYSKFRDSDDYDRQRSGYGNFGVGYSAGSWGLSDSEAREIRKQQSQKDAQESQRALAEYTAAKKEFERVDSEWRTMDDRYRSFTIDEYDKDLTEKWQAAKKRMTDAENSLLGARNRMDAYNATWGKIDQYAGDAAAAKGTDTSYTGPGYESIVDWENKKNEEQAAQDAQAQRADYVPGTIQYTRDTEPTAEDRLGLWRSLTPEQKQDAVSSSNVQLNNIVMAGNDGYWDLLTDNEIETYYYIKGQRGQEAANQYLDDMYIELSRRNELKTVQSIENANSWEKAGLTAVSVGANLVGAIPAALGKTTDMVTGRTNPYSSMQFFQRYASYIRGSVGQDIGDWTESKLADKFGEQFAAKAGNLANQTFQALMSGVDSMAGAMTFGQGLALPAGPFNFHVGGYTTVMGMGAFAQRAQELELKGATPTQIAIGSIGSGILEALFEDVSMEVFFTNILDNPAKTAGEFVKKLAIQMGVEGSEEMFTEMGNIILDAINMGKNSENSMAVREYMAQGMTEEKARQQVWKDNAVDILWAGYGGAISAGAMAAGGQALSSGVNRVHSTVGNYAVGSQLLENGRAVDLQEQAESLTNEKKRAKLQKAAAEVANKASAGDKSFRNTYRTGKVATQIAQQAGREARGAETAEFRKAAEKYLEGQRGIQNKKHALNVLTRVYDGTAMLPGDKAYMRMIGGEKLTQEILNSVGGKETLQENAKPSVEASMRTIGNVQGSVLGIAPETKAEFDSDNSGQAFRKSDSEPINILASEPIAKVENGVLYLNTDDGQEIAASDVSYGNSGEAAVYAAISNMQTDTETARSLLSGIDDSGLSSAAYARAIRNAYYRGMNGVKFEDTPGYSDAAKLPETQRRAAWEAGKQRRAAKVQAQEALIDSGKAGTRESGVTMQESAKSIRSLNKQQQTGMAAAKALAAAGLHVEVYASTEAERKAGKPNGVYRKADGSIAIDLNAGDNGQGAVAYALAHETTHFIKDYSPAKYEAYAQMIIAAAENKGISYDSLIARQMARLSEMEEYKGLSETELQEIAYDETIAEMSETILTDTDAANRLSQQIYEQDRTLWQKIKDFFTGLVEKLRNAYKDSDPDSDIGRMLKRAVQDNTEIAQAWAEAVAEAGENYQLQDGQKKNAREGVRYSLRGTTDGKTVAVVDEDILSNIDLTQWNNQTKKKVQAAAKEALKKFSDGIVVDGVTRNVNRVSRREFAASDYSEMLSKKAPQLFADKMRTASAIDDVVIATTDWARDGKLKHPRTDNFVDFDHGRVLIKAGENQYSAEVVVGITDKGTAVFYDVVDIQPAHFQMQKEESPTDVTTNKSPDVIHGNSSEDTLPQQGTEVKGNVRYSDRNSQSRQVERLEKKNAELKAETEYLKQVVNVQKSGNKAHILDRSSVNAIGKGLMESVNAKGGEFGKLLNDFYRALGTEDMSYETMQDRAGELADWLLEHHQAERDGYAQDILDFLKKRRVSLSDGQIGDIEYTYGSLNDFKRAIKGSIILDQNAETSLDQLWQEAAAQFPDRFGADVTESNMPDGLAQIVSWANSTESSSEAEFQYYRAEQKADLMQKILMGYLEAKPMESVSDNMKKELETLKEQHKREIKQLRKEWDAEAAAMEKSHAYDLEAEKKRGAAAIDAMKAAQAAIDKANAALWEVERNEIKLSYDRQMAKLRTTYSTDTAAYQNEFFEALKSEEYKDAKSPTLRRMLKELANEKSDGNKDAETSRKQVYENLRQQYELEKDIGKLEAKVKQQREAAAQKVESRKKTEERHKLQNTIDTLNKYLLQPTNTAHVPQGLQSSVAMALRAINGVIGDSKAAQNADRLAEYAYRLRELEKNPSANGDKIADLNRKIQNLTGKDSSMKAALAELQEQYHKLETQGDSLYDSNIEALIQNTMEQIGDTEYRNLSLQQLKAVRDSYTALLTTIRNANKAFVAGKNARIDEMVKRATTELSLMKKKNPNQTAIGRNIDQFFWNNEKPVYAFERIGSAVMSELYDNLRKGEDTFYRDVSEARNFFLESAEKNGFSKWDLNELKEFTAANGQKFQLSLDELMSLYAYSLRPQAREHLTKGGIVLGENTKRFTKGPLGVTRETTYNDANAYTLTDETIDAIAGSLTKEQRQFAFEMQQYLAKIMGAKGDEVNMALYGIKKFGEETYWPLKSSDVFSERVRAQQDNPGNKLKTKGFTKALTPKANNAIELSTLTETWAEHVSDMSMYHSFTLPMEDFYRVYNWNQKGDGTVRSTMGVRQLIQKTAGKGAVNYIDQFLKDLNGGLRADPRETVSKAMLSGFKKAAVSASLSVAIQQPSAVGRALAYIEPKYFIGSKVEGKKFAETWKQLKKYAAVAGLKEMGRFDVDMGRSTLEYIIGRNGLSTWGKITDKVDKFSGWLPEMADQVTWCGIWEAAKRKTAAQNPGLRGEALLQKAGELFTDTITRTQVYDSVFSRSANMRSKSGLMSMATAFMAEPTTTANMVEDAVRKFARGDKRMAGKVLSSVAVATVLNAALASVVYAARDDDDDKTYWEKYMASLAGETVDSLNPLTYIPVLSDINNLLLGYSIERTDMSLASDLITALKKITTLYGKYDDEWSDEKKDAWKKKVRTAWLDNAWMVGTVMGLPLKNVVRDVEAVINTARNPSNGAEMNADTVLKAMKDSARKNFPILSWKADESSSDQLYKAITQGKDVLARRLKALFGDEKKYESALLKGLRENDPRIKTAAQYAIDGNTPKRVAIIREIVADGHYTQDQVIKAINQKANSMKEKTQSGKESPPEKLYDYSEYVNAAANGLGYAGDVQKELIRYQADRNQEADGKLTRQEAESDALKTFQSNVKSDAKDGYAAGELTEAQVRKVLTAADIAEDEELDDLILQWDTEMELGDEISWSNARYLDYAETIHPAGISADTYDSYIRAVSKLSSIDEDGDGKEDITKQEQVIEYIDSMPISAEQKDALFQAEYPKARKSVLRKLPWR